MSWMKQAAADGQRGASLIGVLMAVALFPLVLFGAMGLLNHFLKSTVHAISQGEEEDIRNYIRQKFDCKRTVSDQRQACKQGGNVRLLDKNGKPVFDGGTAMEAGKYRLQASCETGTSPQMTGVHISISSDTVEKKTCFGSRRNAEDASRISRFRMPT